MAMLKCKMCGGDMELSPDKTFGTCEYCGSTMTLPRISDEQRAARFNRGNHFRRLGEFDKALAIYENIVREDEDDAEAHWCCALCRFGIEYVEDPATYEYVPTCHRASFDSILEDVDYQAALEHSDGVTRRQYQRDAAKIAEVQRGILATVNKEEPFDVFLCYKETDEQTGQRSRDSLDAQEVYYRLTEKGYRVFFARITLEDKAGAEYEPYIFAALQSAKVMIVLGEKPEHFSAVWVKNEWSRYLALMKKDRSRLLIPCYKNMDPYDLPEQLSVLQSYDMAKIGFLQDLIRGVGKVLDADKPKETAPAPAQTVVREVVQGSGGVNLTAQIKRGQIALEDRDWASADAFFDKALDMDAECAEAYFGKALAAAKCTNGEEFVRRRLEIPVTDTEELIACEHNGPIRSQAVKDFSVPGYLSEERIRGRFVYDKGNTSTSPTAGWERFAYDKGNTYTSLTASWERRIFEEGDYWKNDRLLSRSVRYAKGTFEEKLTALRNQIDESLRRSLKESKAADLQKKEAVAARYAQRTEQAAQSIKEWYETAIAKREEDYQTACKAQERANDVASLCSAAAMFETEGLKAYKDSTDRAKELREKADMETKYLRLEAENKMAACRAKKKKTAILVATIAASVAFVVAVVLIVTKVIIPEKNYNEAVALTNVGDYDGAIVAFSALGNYKDSAEKAVEAQNAVTEAQNAAAYAAAEALFVEGDYVGAIEGYIALGNYKDSAERVALIKEIRAEAVNAAEYAKAEALLEAGDHENAIQSFAALGDYRDSRDRVYNIKYKDALQLKEKGEYEKALAQFTSIRTYQDSIEQIQEIKNIVAQPYKFLIGTYKSSTNTIVISNITVTASLKIVVQFTWSRNEYPSRLLDSPVEALNQSDWKFIMEFNTYDYIHTSLTNLIMTNTTIHFYIGNNTILYKDKEELYFKT